MAIILTKDDDKEKDTSGPVPLSLQLPIGQYITAALSPTLSVPKNM